MSVTLQGDFPRPTQPWQSHLLSIFSKLALVSLVTCVTLREADRKVTSSGLITAGSLQDFYFDRNEDESVGQRRATLNPGIPGGPGGPGGQMAGH